MENSKETSRYVLGEFYDWLSQFIGISPALQSRILQSLILILVLWLINKIILRILFRQSDDVVYRYRWRKTQSYVLMGVGLVILGQIWIAEFRSLSTFFGLLSAGIAIALKDPITDIAGWLFILWRKPFEVGDRIQIGTHAGDVIDIRIFQFTIIEVGNWVDADQSTGRIMHVPNSMVFREVLANYTARFNYIWHEIGILVTFESNWQSAKQILERILAEQAEHITPEASRRIKEATKKYMIFYKNLKPIVYTSVKDSGVMLTMRFLCNPRQRRMYTNKIWEEILMAFGKADDIDFAYPTQRFYNNIVEGKAKAGPPADR
jgi:small-conductance mechanosensitive channel